MSAGIIDRLVDAKPGEMPALVAAFAYNFLLFTAYLDEVRLEFGKIANDDAPRYSDMVSDQNLIPPGDGAKAAAAIASNAEWRETRPAQFSCPESELIAKVREVLARHDVTWG